MGHLSNPHLLHAGILSEVPACSCACSFSKVVLLVIYFLLNTTCNCVFMWNSTMPLQAPCAGVYANNRTRNEYSYGWDFLSFYVFHIHLFSLSNWISVSCKKTFLIMKVSDSLKGLVLLKQLRMKSSMTNGNWRKVFSELFHFPFCIIPDNTFINSVT